MERPTPLVRLCTRDASSVRSERRQHVRQSRRKTLFVQLVTGDSRVTVKGVTADLSRGGLKLLLDVPPARGTRLELWPRLAGAPHPYYLAATVQWCSTPSEPGAAGVDVQAAPGTDYAAWRTLSLR
jgi:hypothetical protein